MPDQTTPGGAMPPEAGATPTQTAAAGTAGAPATGATAPDADALAALGDPGKRALDAMKADRTAAEKRADAAEKALKALQEAQLSETEKKDKRLAELELKEADWTRERQDFILRGSVQQAAAKLGFADPGDAMGLLDRAAIEFDKDSGAPKNVDTLLADLAKTKPYLLGRPRFGSADSSSVTAAGAGLPTFTRAQLRDHKFYTDNQAAIMQAMKDGRISG